MRSPLRTRLRTAILRTIPTSRPIRLSDLDDALAAVMAELDTPHIVDIAPDRWSTEHPIACRDAGLRTCPIDQVMTALTTAPAPDGRYLAELDDGALKLIPTEEDQ